MKIGKWLAILGLCASSAANAVPVTYSFSASWNFDVEGPLSALTFGLASTQLFSAGDTISGTFSYDSAAPMILGPGPSVYVAAFTNLSAVAAGHAMSDPTGYGVINAAADSILLLADPDVGNPSSPAPHNFLGYSTNGFNLKNIRIFWVDDPSVGGDTDPVTNESLPGTLPPDGFAPGEARIGLDFVNDAGDRRHISFFQNLTVSVVSVPEPETIALFALALIALTLTRMHVQRRLHAIRD